MTIDTSGMKLLESSESVNQNGLIGENVEGIINIQEGMVLRQVQTDLEKEGFEVQCLIIPASGIGAWHQRKRVWIIGCNVSNSNHEDSAIGENSMNWTKKSQQNYKWRWKLNRFQLRQVKCEKQSLKQKMYRTPTVWTQTKIWIYAAY